jgi:hypothetical protein
MNKRVGCGNGKNGSTPTLWDFCRLVGGMGFFGEAGARGSVEPGLKNGHETIGRENRET